MIKFLRACRSWRAVAAMFTLALASSALVVAPSADGATQTVVSLTFDDGQASQHAAGSVLSQHGMAGTFYINSGYVGSSGYYMTWPQIHDLANAGHEIGGHTVHHTNLTQVDTATATREVCDDRTALLNQGFSPLTSFAYPYAAKNLTMEQIVASCGYDSGRGVGNINSGTVCGSCPYAETIPPRDAYALRTPEGATSGTTLSDLETYVTNAETHGGGWVILVFHGVCDNSCTGTNSLGTSTFASFLDWLQPRATNGTVVRTVGDVMGAPTSPPTPTTTMSCNDSACTNGWYNAAVKVSLASSDSTATIRYSTDGSDPVTIYSEPFYLLQTTTVRYYSGTETPKSQLVSIDAALPSVTITRPDSGSVLWGTKVTITATAVDAGTGSAAASGIDRVAFRIDGTLLATDTTFPYETVWNTRKASRTTHILTAVATDRAGNETTSAAVSVTITR
jgi:peptidoglycan/xylan/chitin deacetylase (PgdA/CDA1 family)